MVSKQDNDQYQAQYQSQIAGVNALEKAILAQRANIAAAEANLSRLNEMQGYRIVKAPFAGVITLRNVDVGALVTTGSTMLYRIAQTDTLRTYVNVPQTNASSIHAGQKALVSVTNLPGRTFTGTVARTANSLDPSSRTLLVEVQVPNPDGALMPGMYAQVDFSNSRANAPLLVPAEALMVRADGTQIAVVGPDSIVHLQKIVIGRDYGDRLEVLQGLQVGDRIIANPDDNAREGVKVDAVEAAEKPAAAPARREAGEVIAPSRRTLTRLQQDRSDIIRAAELARQRHQLLALGFERTVPRQNLADAFVGSHAMQPIAAQQNLRAGRRAHAIVVHPQLPGDANRHGQHVAHGMNLQRFLVQSQPPPDLVHPGLVVGDRLQLAVLKQVSPAVAHAGDKQVAVVFDGGHQSGAHAFHRLIGVGFLHHPLIGFGEGVEKIVGRGGGRGGFEGIANGFHRQPRRMFSGLRAAHAVRHHVQSGRGQKQEAVFVVGADATWVRNSE